jgi:hypothetical protein
MDSAAYGKYSLAAIIAVDALVAPDFQRVQNEQTPHHSRLVPSTARLLRARGPCMAEAVRLTARLSCEGKHRSRSRRDTPSPLCRLHAWLKDRWRIAIDDTEKHPQPRHQRQAKAGYHASNSGLVLRPTGLPSQTAIDKSAPRQRAATPRPPEDS